MEKKESRAIEGPKTSLSQSAKLGHEYLEPDRGKKDDSYNPEEIFRGLFGVRVKLTDFRRPPPRLPRARQRKEKHDSYDPDEILCGSFGARVVLTGFRRSLPPPPPSPRVCQMQSKLLINISQRNMTIQFTFCLLKHVIQN